MDVLQQALVDLAGAQLHLEAIVFLEVLEETLAVEIILQEIAQQEVVVLVDLVEEMVEVLT